MRDAASTTDSTLELWLATYTVRPSGETATPSGSLPTLIVPITVGLARLDTRCASGTRSTVAVEVGATLCRVGRRGGQRQARRGGRCVVLPVVDQGPGHARPAEQHQHGEAGDQHGGAEVAARLGWRRGRWRHHGHPGGADVGDAVDRAQPGLDRGPGHRPGQHLAGHPHVGPAGRAAYGDRPVQPLGPGQPDDAQPAAVQHGAQAGTGDGDRGRGDRQRRPFDVHVRDQARGLRRDLAEVDPVRVDAHGGALQRRGRRGGDAAAVVLGEMVQCVPRGRGHGEIGAAREPGELVHGGQARLPDRTVDLGQHMRWQASFTHRIPTIIMRDDQGSE